MNRVGSGIQTTPDARCSKCRDIRSMSFVGPTFNKLPVCRIEPNYHQFSGGIHSVVAHSGITPIRLRALLANASFLLQIGSERILNGNALTGICRA